MVDSQFASITVFTFILGSVGQRLVLSFPSMVSPLLPSVTFTSFLVCFGHIGSPCSLTQRISQSWFSYVTLPPCPRAPSPPWALFPRAPFPPPPITGPTSLWKNSPGCVENPSVANNDGTGRGHLPTHPLCQALSRREGASGGNEEELKGTSGCSNPWPPSPCAR